MIDKWIKGIAYTFMSIFVAVIWIGVSWGFGAVAYAICNRSFDGDYNDDFVALQDDWFYQNAAIIGWATGAFFFIGIGSVAYAFYQENIK